MYSTFSQQSSTSHTSKNFMSFSSLSVLDQSKGPSLRERLKTNLFYLAINIDRYKNFSTHWITFVSIIRILQNYAVLLMPGHTDFWQSEENSKFFISILTLPIHFCFIPGDTTFHSIMVMIFGAVLIISCVILFFFLIRDIKFSSYSNRELYFICFLIAVLVPIFQFFAFSSLGTVMKHLVFWGRVSFLTIVASVIGFISIIVSFPLVGLSFPLIRSRCCIDMSILFSTWGSQTVLYYVTDQYLVFMGFFEEFLPLNEELYMIIFVVLILVATNPFVIYFTIRGCTFQDHSDTKFFLVQCCNTMLSCILMLLTFHTDSFTPTLMLTCAVLCFVVFYYAFDKITNYEYNNIVKKLSSVYKYIKPVLPPLSPLLFTNPESIHIGLTQEAYGVVQSFNSLNIKSSAEFHRYVGVGSAAKLTAITNLDFIKWGLIQFHDSDTLVDAAQICEHFGDKQHVLPVILQAIEGDFGHSLVKDLVINTIHTKYNDSLSDLPPLLQMLRHKAHSGLSRCHRAEALFWGAVLNHSQSAMKSAFCKLRDCIQETQCHFDELNRCYPYFTITYSLYISFLTEIRGYFNETENYINTISQHMINAQNDDSDPTVDPLADLNDILNDKTKPYNRFTSDLSTYMEQERVSNVKTNRPMIALWSICLISLVVIIICFITIISKTLVTFQTYPNYVNIIRSCTEAITSMASMTISARRMCLFSKDLINTDEKFVPFGNSVTDASVFDNATILLPYFITNTEQLSTIMQRFYQNTAYDNNMLNAIENNKTSFILYGNPYQESLSFGLDLMTNSLRNIAGNVPSLFTGSELKNDFTLDFLSDPTGTHISNFALFKKLEMKYDQQQKKQEEKEQLKRFIQKMNQNRTAFNFQYDPVELYSTTCQSPSIKHLLLNVKPMATLLKSFLDSYLVIIDGKVNDFDYIAFICMIFLPIAFIFLFITAVLIISYFVIKESNFRTTLYMSLPENVALEIYRSKDSGKNMKAEPTIVVKKNMVPRGSVNGIRMINQSSDSESLASSKEILQLNKPDDDNEIEQLRAKAITIENLKQMSSSKNALIQTTGIQHFIGWSIFYIIYGAIFIFGLTYYASTVNIQFNSCSHIIKESSNRFLNILYSTVYTFEFFFQDDDVKLIDPSDVYKFSKESLMDAINSHNILTFGSEDIDSDFRDDEEIKMKVMSNLNVNRMNVPEEAFPSYATISHDGYKQFGFDIKFRVYSQFLLGLMENFNTNNAKYQRNDPVWEEFDHFFYGHLIKDLNEVNEIYLQSVTEIIDESFLTAIVLSILSLLVLIIIFLWPIRMALTALFGYFDITFHTLCKISPHLFRRSLYINKWLKGEIHFTNYKKYENSFKRTLSKQLQSDIIKESPEKIVVFDNNGKFVPVDENLQIEGEPNLEKILSNYCETNEDLVERVDQSIQRFINSHDVIDPVIIKTKDKENHPIRLLIKGVKATDANVSTNIQKYYGYAVIIIKDISKDDHIRDEYIKQKEKTLSLLAEVVPKPFAVDLHKEKDKFVFTAGIASVITCELSNFQELSKTVDYKELSHYFTELHLLLENSIINFPNISKIICRDGKLILIAGLFNEEQNGRTEAIDSIQFIASFHPQIIELMKKYKVNNYPKYGISTGGPIYCKLLMGNPPHIIVSDETTLLSNAICEHSTPNFILMERTTYECSYGLNIEAQISSDIEYHGKNIPIYSISVDSLKSLNQAPTNQ